MYRRDLSASRSHSSTGMSVTSSRASHPLGNDDELIELSPNVQREISTQIHATVDRVLHAMVGGRPWDTTWRFRGTKKDVAFYIDDTVEADQYRFCCVGETTARTEEIIQLFCVSDTETLLKNNRIVYNNVLDARLLSVLEKPTRDRPFQSVYLR